MYTSVVIYPFISFIKSTLYVLAPCKVPLSLRTSLLILHPASTLIFKQQIYMFAYQKFRIGKTDHFDETKYPQINTDLKTIALQLGDAAPTPGGAMLLSFVKDHRINSKSVADYPALASMISTKELPLSALEELFEASKQNPTFQKELESHIQTYFDSFDTSLSRTKQTI